MIVVPTPPTDTRPWTERLGFAIAHPIRWLRDLTGGEAIYPLLILFGLNAIDELDRTAFGVLLPEIQRAFGLDVQGILTVATVVIGVSLILQIPVAYVADRSNRVRLALGGAFVWAIFAAGTGMAIVVTSLWMLYATRIGSGLGKSVIDPSHRSLLADYYSVGQRARVYAFHASANSVGQIIGPVLGALLWTVVKGWAFVALTVPMVVLLVLAARLREPVRGAKEREAMGMADEVVALEEPPPSFEEAWRMVQRVATLRRVYGALPFLAPAFIGFAFLAALKYDSLGLSVVERGFLAVPAEISQLLGLYLGARWGTKKILVDPGAVLNMVSRAAFVAAALAAAFALAPNVAIAAFANVGIALTLAMVLPSVMATLSLTIPPRARAVGFSIVALYLLPGVVVALPLVGWLSGRFGIESGMLLMTPLFVLGGLVVSSASDLVADDIRNMWTATAARSELLYDRRQGNIKQLLCRSVDVKYGDVQILFGVDFEVSEGEIIALLGTNGAGKSTLLKAICGVVEASSGAIIFDGRDITHAPAHEIAEFGISMVPGGQGVFPSLTVSENLRAAGWLDRKRGDDPAPRVAEVLSMFPVLADRLDDPAANLSGGQQQMLALGMAFLSKPKLLAIDELSLGLAPVIVEQLLPIVRRIADNGTTVILVEQSVNVALTLAETAVFMEKGEIRFRGPTAELLDRPDVLRSVFLEGASKGLTGGGGDPGFDAQHAADRLGADPSADEGLGGVGAVASGAPPISGPATTRSRAPDTGGLLAGDAVARARSALEVSDLSVRFGGIRAVDGVSFALQQGEVIGIIGPNGAGKTTMFDLISGFTASDTGRVFLEGRELTGLTPDRRAWAGLGRSFQDARLFPALTVEETIAVALERWLPVKDPFNAALRLPAFQDSEDSVQRSVDELIELMGIETFRSKFIHELSTGSRRVVDLACTVAHHPKVVMLDEPSSGIAQRETEALGPLILRIRDTLQASIIVIEHDMPLISSVSDRLVALDQGHVVTIGAPDEVLSHPEVVASYLGNSDEVINRSGARADA